MAGNRTIIALECTACKERNYSTTKNKKKTQEKLARSKYCPRCRKHVQHMETKLGVGRRRKPAHPSQASSSNG